MMLFGFYLKVFKLKTINDSCDTTAVQEKHLKRKIFLNLCGMRKSLTVMLMQLGLMVSLVRDLKTGLNANES